MTKEKDYGYSGDDFDEKLAAFIHDNWANWMRWMFTLTTDMGHPRIAQCIDGARVSRWTRQLNTRYEDLPENEKESDREIAKRLVVLLDQRSNDDRS